MSAGGERWTVLATELRTLLRDRRAFVLAVVLPMVLFPLLFFGMDRLEQSSEEGLAELEVVLGYDLSALAPGEREQLIAALAPEERNLRLSSQRLPSLATQPAPDGEVRAQAALLLEEGTDLLLAARRLDGDEGTALRLVFDGSSNRGLEAHRRVRDALEERNADVRLERLVTTVGSDPGAWLALEGEDLASAEDALGHGLGTLLPLVLVVVVISSASFVALGAFSGEREQGTLETLLVQPVPARALAQGKFLAVLVVALLAATGNAASFLVSVELGLGAARGLVAAGSWGTGLARLGLGLVLFLPTAVFLAGVLALVSARARSFREGQHYVLPVVLVSALLASVSTQASVPSNALFALVPVAGATLALRDALAGSLPALPSAIAFVAACGWTWLLLRRLEDTLDGERLFRTAAGVHEAGLRRDESRHALRWGLASVAAVYIVGGRMQIAHPIGGLLLTLWVLVPALALACARGRARRTGESLRTILGLELPAPRHLLVALLLAPGLAQVMTWLLSLQARFLPLPPGGGLEPLLETFQQLGPASLLFLVALSPAWNEELLFRGALLRGLRHDLPPRTVVLWQALLFGAVHASVHRFLGTAFLGGVLAALTLRARSLWPAVLLHATYNGLVVLDAPALAWWSPAAAVLLGLGGAGLLLGPRVRAEARGAAAAGPGASV